MNSQDVIGLSFLLRYLLEPQKSSKPRFIIVRFNPNNAGRGLYQQLCFIVSEPYASCVAHVSERVKGPTTYTLQLHRRIALGIWKPFISKTSRTLSKSQNQNSFANEPRCLQSLCKVRSPRFRVEHGRHNCAIVYKTLCWFCRGTKPCLRTPWRAPADNPG